MGSTRPSDKIRNMKSIYYGSGPTRTEGIKILNAARLVDRWLAARMRAGR
jgi:hypothetical protein